MINQLAVGPFVKFNVLHFRRHGEIEETHRLIPHSHEPIFTMEPTTAAELPTLKILLIGVCIRLTQSSGVGKSALVRRYTDDEFVDGDQATIGVDFKMKSIYVQGKWFKLSIWDTAGQERYRTLTSSYYRGAQGVILVYDVTSEESFAALPSWMKELEMFTGAEEPVKLLIGNKTDQDTGRIVAHEDAAAWAKSQNCLFVECSAKENVHVSKAFEELVQRIASTPELWQDVAPGVRRPGDRIPGGAPNAPGTISLSDATSYVTAARERCGC